MVCGPARYPVKPCRFPYPSCRTMPTLSQTKPQQPVTHEQEQEVYIAAGGGAVSASTSGSSRSSTTAAAQQQCHSTLIRHLGRYFYENIPSVAIIYPDRRRQTLEALPAQLRRQSKQHREVLSYTIDRQPYPRPAQRALTSPKPKPTLRSPFGFWTLLSTFWMALAC